MTNTVVFITGSAVGIGRGIAVSHAREGAIIAGLDIDAQENEITRTLVESAGGTFHGYHVDVGDKLAVRSAFSDLEQKIERIDLLVNNAAVFSDTTLTGGNWEQQATAFEQAMGACAMGAYFCTAAAVSLLQKAGSANVINILTDHVKPGHELTGSFATGYDCAKFSLLRLTENWAVELKDKGIRVNGLCFGATDTPMLRKFAPHMVDTGMVVDDIDTAIRHVINQGPNGETGQSYEFGMGPTPRSTSLEQIERIRR